MRMYSVCVCVCVCVYTINTYVLHCICMSICLGQNRSVFLVLSSAVSMNHSLMMSYTYFSSILSTHLGSLPDGTLATISLVQDGSYQDCVTASKVVKAVSIMSGASYNYTLWLFIS